MVWAVNAVGYARFGPRRRESEGDGERGEAPRVDALECDASDAGAKANANAADERKHTRYAEQESGGRHANFHD